MSRSREGYLWTQGRLTQGLPTQAVISRAATANLQPSYDVLVIGAGFAGLRAARELTRHYGLRVLIVEGRDRIGGRTWTAQAFGEDFEMGGTWVHWNQPHLCAELHRYGLHKNLKSSACTLAAQKTYYKEATGEVVEVDGNALAETTQAVADRVFTIDGFSSRELMPYPHDPFREPAPWKRYDHLTVRQRLDQLDDIPDGHKGQFESAVNTFGSAPSAEIGFVEVLRWYALGGHNMAQVFELAGVYKLAKGGMTSFARSILKDAWSDILLDTTVSEITQTGPDGPVVARAKDGRTFRAKAVVCTVPLNCLGDVKFSPPLSPLKREAIAKGHINKGAKIHFRLAQTEPGWFAACDGHAASSSSFCFAFSDHNGTSPTSGPRGTYCIGFGFNGCLRDPRDSRHVVEEFNRDVRPSAVVEGYLTHDWMNDPLAKGVWSCWGSHCTTKYLQELQKAHGNVFFASADWALGWRGFVDGALESGSQTAQAVAETLCASPGPRL
ncbi:lysyl oxidase-like protein 2/3/4 [Cladophialophora yegresii CBS 114405]|uniref:Amine oxidase n=1 Tax=Cladophialophora yegresii CBS 114405 TaxID=1182544 RepID=W9W588_9EURO|nr:lysyl oxidase-like protein 2/3/4 [Cladophialophora yegresii CBS 114405]EXJ63123.1 lysyl oxidase-like protein 2/3/4 [Cladophialophora yegresii CBS 114405]